MRIILLGPPGCGKGTQGNLMEKEYGFPKISTGNLLRSEVQEGTPLGKKAEAKMNRGELVSDEIVIEMIKKRIFRPEYKRGYILDGFPRNISQAQRLEEVDKKHTELALEIYLSDRVVFERLGARRICSSCGIIYNLIVKAPGKEGVCDVCMGRLVLREDDTPEVIKDRLKVYHEQTEALIGYYKEKKAYHRIDGERKIETVFDSICSILNMEIAKSREAEIAR